MKVAIVGGGFAGRMAVTRLARAGHGVTLIDPFDDFVERTRLHEAAAVGRSVRHPHRRLTDAVGAQFHRGRVVGVEDGTLHLQDGQTQTFDRIVISAGSVVDRSVPGVREHALALGDPEEAAQIHARLGALAEGATVVVVGAGATGQELATEIAEAHRLSVILIGDPEVGLSTGGSRIVRRAMAELGVEVQRARVRSVGVDGLETDRGPLSADLVLWAGGMRAPSWMASAGLPVDARGQLVVEPSLRVRGRPHLVAAGDCAASGLRMSCAVAMPLGCHAAETLVREARGLDPRPFRFAYVHRLVSFGRRRAVAQLTLADDAPRTAIGGRPASWYKDAVLYSAVRAPEWEARTGASLYGWPKGQARAALPTSHPMPSEGSMRA